MESPAEWLVQSVREVGSGSAIDLAGSSWLPPAATDMNRQTPGSSNPLLTPRMINQATRLL